VELQPIGVIHTPYTTKEACPIQYAGSIGLSIVKLIERDGNVLHVEGVDMLDGAPLLDIKPYLPKFDHIDSASNGWTEGKAWRPKPEGRE
jgi:tRNA (adenine37-N6)-methyltransferase